MALSVVDRKPMTRSGNKLVVVVEIDTGGVGNVTFESGLHFIESVDLQGVDTQDMTLDAVKNSNDGTEGTAAGSLWLSGHADANYIVTLVGT